MGCGRDGLRTLAVVVTLGLRMVIEVMTTTLGGTTTLEKVAYTSVFVTNQDRALDFYTNVLGLERIFDNPTPDGPRFLTVGLDGQDFRLVLWPGRPGRPSPGPYSGRVHDRYRGLPSDGRGADGARRDVRDGRARVPPGYLAMFQDPDGNRLAGERTEGAVGPPADTAQRPRPVTSSCWREGSLSAGLAPLPTVPP